MTVVEWLLDSSIGWQAMRDLTGEPADVVAAERSRVAFEGWGARLLDLQARPNGQDDLRSAGAEPDDRIAEAIAWVEKNRRSDGRWPLQNPHAGHLHFDMEAGADGPSRWNTLRALRVLNWPGHGG